MQINLFKASLSLSVRLSRKLNKTKQWEEEREEREERKQANCCGSNDVLHCHPVFCSQDCDWWAGQGGDCDILCVELSQSENVIPIFFSIDRSKSSVDLLDRSVVDRSEFSFHKNVNYFFLIRSRTL